MTIFEESLDYLRKKLEAIFKKLPKRGVINLCKSLLDARRIFVYGAGRSGLVAKAFAIRLVHLGFQSYVIGETITPPVRRGDLVLIISGSGETMPSVMTADIARDIGAKVVAIVGEKKSSLAEKVDMALVLSTECKDEERARLAPLGTLFEASAWLLLDSIVAELIYLKGEDEEKMKRRHATLQ